MPDYARDQQRFHARHRRQARFWRGVLLTVAGGAIGGAMALVVGTEGPHGGQAAALLVASGVLGALVLHLREVQILGSLLGGLASHAVPLLLLIKAEWIIADTGQAFAALMIALCGAAVLYLTGWARAIPGD